MTEITNYQESFDGSHTVVINGVHLNKQALRLLDNHIPVSAKVEIIDNDLITDKQRRKIFTLLNDIYEWTYQPHEDLREQFQFYLETMKGYPPISLSDCSKKIASELIELIIAWVFLHDIPLNYKTSDLLKQDKAMLYWSTVNRKCVICGKPHADLAHHYAIGSGANRKQMDHYDYEVLALCREHHTEQHAIGIHSFDDKYHLHDSWIKPDKRINNMLKGVKTNE